MRGCRNQLCLCLCLFYTEEEPQGQFSGVSEKIHAPMVLVKIKLGKGLGTLLRTVQYRNGDKGIAASANKQQSSKGVMDIIITIY